MDLKINGINCHYEQVGEGKDLLLLHGWGGCIDSWLPVTEHFKQNCRVTVIDFPGHGKSGFPPEEGWTVDDYCTFTAAFIEQTGISGCDIIAHSFGGRVALLLAATRPELIGKLLLTDAAGLLPKRSKGYYLKTNFFKTMKKLTYLIPNSDELRKKLSRFGSADYKALSPEMRKTFVKIISLDLTDELPRVKAPTLLYWGAEDTETPLWMGKLMEEKIPDAGLVVQKGAGHFAYLEHNQAFLRIAKNFLLEGRA